MRRDMMNAAPPDAQPVARWEFFGLAIMLIATHGADAEAYAQAQLNAAMVGGAEAAGARTTWAEVVKLLPEARLSQQRSKQG